MINHCNRFYFLSVRWKSNLIIHTRVGLRLMHIHHINNIAYLCTRDQFKASLTEIEHSFKLAGNLLCWKNHIYECWILVKSTLNWLYVHKYALLSIWCPRINLSPTLKYICCLDMAVKINWKCLVLKRGKNSLLIVMNFTTF